MAQVQTLGLCVLPWPLVMEAGTFWRCWTFCSILAGLASAEHCLPLHTEFELLQAGTYRVKSQ